MTSIPSAADSLLGKAADYAGHYDAARLFPIPRAGNRAGLPLAGVPMFGVDVWNAYELSWLQPGGKPALALAELRVPADSPNLIESKSLKLYLNGFMQTQCASAGALQATLVRDLSQAAGAAVEVQLHAPDTLAGQPLQHLSGECIDALPLSVNRYGPPAPELLRQQSGQAVHEQLVSHLLKSNCPVTGQPDWASVQIEYRAGALDRSSLLAYLLSFREHAEFHEHCVEQIFADLWHALRPQSLSVYARYTRRGGIDINPFRSSDPSARPDNPRLPRQ